MFGRVFIAPIMAAAGVAPLAFGVSQTTRQSSDIPGLVQSLADPDSTVRQQASERLSTLPAARPELIRVARSDDPEQRARAAEVLRKLPWDNPTDPPVVRSALQNYGQAPSDGMRVTIAKRLADQDGGGEVLLRLLAEEPSEAIRWQIVEFFVNERELASHPRLRSAAMQRKLRELDVSADDAPMLVLCGKAWLERNRAQALGLFRRAVDADQVRPVNDHGVLTLAFDELIAQHVRQGEFDRAAELLRLQVPRDRLNDESFWQRLGADSWSLAQLAALHRYFGPLRGSSGDERTWGHPTESAPRVSNRVLDLLEQLGVEPPLPREQPFELSVEDRLAAGDFLLRHKLLAAAEMELGAVLDAIGQDPQRYTEYFATLALARIAVEQGRDAEAAGFFERAARAKLQADIELPDDEVRVQIHFRRARVAHSRGDLVAAGQQVEELLRYTPPSNDETIAIIRWLKETNRVEQARVLFEKVLGQARAQLDAEEFKPGLQNDIAWLCARCDERLEEAIELSRAAVEAMPESAAFLDTAAEANYRKGNVAEAIRLENRALELSPDNEFMHEQLQRFKGRQP